MTERDRNKRGIEKALQEEQRKREWKRQLDRDMQRSYKASRDAQKALLGTFAAPAVLLGATMAQESREWKKQRKAGKKKHSILGVILKFFLFLFVVSILRAAVGQL